MKKIVAMMLALMLVLVSVSALAASVPEYTNGTAPTNMSAEAVINFTVDKTVTVTGTDASLPAQTFAATPVGTATAVTYVKYNDGMTAETEVGAAITGAPTLSITAPGASVAEGGTSGLFTFSTDKAFPQTGVYTYFFKETDGNVAGTVYDFDEGATSPSANGKVFAVRITVVNGTGDNEGHLMVGGISVRPAYKNTTTNKYAIDYSKDKLGEIINYYNAGTLKISKTVTGNMGDKQKEWNFTVTFTSPATGSAQDAVKSIISYVTNGTVGTVAATAGTVDTTAKTITAPTAGWTANTVTFTLKSDADITFKNIPAGTTYTVNEAEAGTDGYTTTISVSDTNSTIAQYGGDEGYHDVTTAISGNQVDGTITAKDTHNNTQDIPVYTVDADVVDYTNDKSMDVDTGIALDTVPYLMIMAIALMGVAMMIVRRREEM